MQALYSFATGVSLKSRRFQGFCLTRCQCRLIKTADRVFEQPVEIELSPKVQHHRSQSDRRTIHEDKLARNGDRPVRTERLLHLPYLAPSVSVRRHPIGNRADPVVQERRVDEPRPDVERVTMRSLSPWKPQLV